MARQLTPLAKGTLVVLGVSGLVCAGVVLSSGDLVEGALVDAAATELDAELTLGDVSVSWWSGKGTLTDVDYRFSRDDADVHVTAETATIAVRPGSLWVGPVEIERVALASPEVVVTLHPEATSSTSLTEMGAAAWSWLKQQVSGDEGQVAEVAPSWVIGDLAATDGTATLRVERKAREPVEITLTDLNWTARDLAPNNLTALVHDAELQASIPGAGGTVSLASAGEARTATVQNIDLAWLDGRFSPDAPVRIQQGSLSVKATSNLGASRYAVTVTGLQVEAARSASRLERLGARKLASHLENRDPQIEIVLTRDAPFEAVPVRGLLRTTWESLWMELAKEVGVAMAGADDTRRAKVGVDAQGRVTETGSAYKQARQRKKSKTTGLRPPHLSDTTKEAAWFLLQVLSE